MKEFKIQKILVACCKKAAKPQFDSGFEYKQFELLDAPDQDIASIFEEAFEFLDNRNEDDAVYVHCH
jgi:hypothetical protein